MASAVVDNVPLVAATMGMYDMAAYPKVRACPRALRVSCLALSCLTSCLVLPSRLALRLTTSSTAVAPLPQRIMLSP